MTRLLLMHSIAIITAVSLLATPTEAMPDWINKNKPRRYWMKLKGNKVIADWIKKKKTHKVEEPEDPEELFQEVRQMFLDLKPRLTEFTTEVGTTPLPKHSRPLHAREAEALRIYVICFDLWWANAVDPDVATEIFHLDKNVELAKEVLIPILRKDNPISLSPHVISSVKSLLKVTKDSKKADMDAEKIKLFVSHIYKAGNVLRWLLAKFGRNTPEESFPGVARQIVAWVQNMRQLTIGAFTYDLRRVKNCSVDVWNPQYLSFSSMATYIASDAFNCVKDYLKSNQSEANYKAFEFRLELLGLLGQIEEQWYKLHNLSIACYLNHEGGQMNDIH